MSSNDRLLRLLRRQREDEADAEQVEVFVVGEILRREQRFELEAHAEVRVRLPDGADAERAAVRGRSEEHTSELQSLMRTSYAVFCLKKKIKKLNINPH